MIDTKRMNATLKDVGRWKRREYGVDACEVTILNLHAMSVGDVVRAMRRPADARAALARVGRGRSLI